MKKIISIIISFTLALCLVACDNITVTLTALTNTSEDKGVVLFADETTQLPLELQFTKSNDEELTEEELEKAVAETKLVYTSSDEAVATVDENGVVTAVAPGEVVVTATAETNEETTVDFAVTVLEVPVFLTSEEVTVTEALEITVVGTGQIEITVEPVEATIEATYTSKDETVATVDENGVVTGIALGETVIEVTVTGYNEERKEVEILKEVAVMVVKPVTSNTVNNTSNTSAENNNSGNGTPPQQLPTSVEWICTQEEADEIVAAADARLAHSGREIDKRLTYSFNAGYLGFTQSYSYRDYDTLLVQVLRACDAEIRFAGSEGSAKATYTPAAKGFTFAIVRG